MCFEQEDWFVAVFWCNTQRQYSSKKPWAKDSLKCCITSLPAGLLDLLAHAVKLGVQFRGDHGVRSILQTAGPVADDFICKEAQRKATVNEKLIWVDEGATFLKTESMISRY